MIRTICFLLVFMLLLSGCNPQVIPTISSSVTGHQMQSTSSSTKANSTIPIKGAIHIDTPYFDTPEKLVTEADVVVEGRVVDITFDIIDRYTGLPFSENKPENMDSLQLETILEIEVLTRYKGEEADTIFVSIHAGRRGYEEEKQKEIMEAAGIYDGGLIVLADDFEWPCIGDAGLFFAIKGPGKYHSFMGIEQFMFKKDDVVWPEAFGYADILAYLDTVWEDDYT